MCRRFAISALCRRDSPESVCRLGDFGMSSLQHCGLCPLASLLRTFANRGGLCVVVLLQACGDKGAGASNTECVPSLDDYQMDEWREPARPTPPSPPLSDVPAVGWHMRLGLPAEANAGDLYTTIWLTGDEDVVLDVQLAVGLDQRIPTDVRGVMLLDGLQRNFEIDGELTEVVRRRIAVGEIDRWRMVVDGSTIEPGAHSLHALFWHGGGSLPSLGLTVIKEDTEFVDVPDPVELPATPRHSWLGASVRRTGEALPLRSMGPDEAFEPDGTLPLSFRISGPVRAEPCPSLVLGSFLLAFVDGEQIDVGELGPRPLFMMREDEETLFDLRIEGLPLDTDDGGPPHMLHFWLVPSNGQYFEAPLGSRSPWWQFSVLLEWLRF